MGYTHYYRQKRDMTNEEFEGFKSDVEVLQKALPKTIGEFIAHYGETSRDADPSDTRSLAIMGQAVDGAEAMFAKDMVGFNGAGFEDADHETFWIPQKIAHRAGAWEMEDVAKGDRFHCTKTARKPYDVMVCACLIALKRRAPTAWRISSDGDVSEWASAYRFAVDALGLRALPLANINHFSEDKVALTKAKAPTEWMRVKKEQAVMEKSVKPAPKVKARSL